MIHQVKGYTKYYPVLALFVALFSFGFLMPDIQAQDFTKYQNFDEITNSIKSLVNSNKNIAKLESIGKTLEGRDIWLVTVANSRGVPTDERPGLFIGANFEGDHLIGS